MRKRSMICLGLFLVSCLLCSGCGTSLTGMSDAKEAQFVAYCSKIVAKYNTKQEKGISNVAKTTDTDSDSTDKTDTSEKTKTTASKTTDSTATDSSTSQTTAATQATTPQTVSLTDALKISGISFSYKDYLVNEDYQQNGADLSPSSGNSFLILEFQMTNTQSQDASVDILSQKPAFKATVNGASTAKNEQTVLLNDLTTYQGTVAAGSTQDLIILFQMSSDTLKNVSGVTLQLTTTSGTYNIAL